MNRDPLPLGVVAGLSIELYHAMTPVSNSGLSDFARSPAHFYALHLDPARPPEAAKAGQLEGNLAHCAILEPDQFGKRYRVGPCNDKRLKAWKDWHGWDESEDDAPVGITPNQFGAAQAQAASVRKNADVAKLFADGVAEVSAFWADPLTGELCRCRPDWVHPVGTEACILVDVKTYSDASPREFARQVARKGYHRQAAFYSDGYEIASGRKVLGFVFVAVETAWPYLSSATMLDDESLAKGRSEIAEMLPRFAHCRETGVWPGYGDGVSLISLPAWALSSTTESTQ